MRATEKVFPEVGGVAIGEPDHWHRRPDKAGNGAVSVTYVDSAANDLTGQMQLYGPLPKDADPTELLTVLMEQQKEWKGTSDHRYSPIRNLSTLPGAAGESVIAEVQYKVSSSRARGIYALLVHERTKMRSMVMIPGIEGSEAYQIIDFLVSTVTMK